ncbi:hypothetical protein WJX73_008232 [Symbiochloris irregularis]|uniref:Alanine--tRNA ligase n=1 Tax=Symbiochloris irregularis TaxID=706552 RepID=A0AAW1NXN3_9CHLO
MDPTARLYGSGLQALKIELVAAFAEFRLERPSFTAGVTDKTPWFQALSPQGQVPVLDTTHGPILGPYAIARYVASQGRVPELYPSAASQRMTRTQIETWVEYALGARMLLTLALGPVQGMKKLDKQWHDIALDQVMKLCKGLDLHLQSHTLLVGAHISLADVVVAAELLDFYTEMFEPNLQRQMPHLHRFLSTMYRHPKFIRVLGAELQPAQHAHKPPQSGQSPTQGPSQLSKFTNSSQIWTGDRVRNTYIEFFQTQGHTAVPSSPVVPVNDPTLLFTNAGMNQFKAVFLGTVDPSSAFARISRACDSQKCIRAGGKHNDLDDVGKDVYHHTFFEMLGNWSFGDYFKKEAIGWAWELLTQVFKLPAAQLYATYFGGDAKLGLGADEEARQIWLQYLPTERVLPFGAKDNFWEMGDQGPCGPCSELHFDRLGGGRDAAHLVNMDDPNVLEIWNLVFIQYNREPNGTLKPLPAKHVDTGMGMERVTSILQDKMSNYATDIFAPIFRAIQEASGAPTYSDKVGAEDVGGTDMAYRVVADHIRTLCFAIADGSRPGNDGREYVLRRVLRRAVRYGREKLKAPNGFFAGLVDSVVGSMGGFYPELVRARDHIHAIIEEEEVSFSRTLLKGIEHFKKAAASAQHGTLDNRAAFLLWSTHGFPIDLTELMAEEAGLRVDKEAFGALMKEEQEKSRADRAGGGAAGLKFEAEATAALQSKGVKRTDDSPKYEPVEVRTRVEAILSMEGFVGATDEARSQEGDLGVVLQRTPFYAEQGGQVADHGTIASASGSFTVHDTRVAAGYVLHVGRCKGTLRVGDTVTASIDDRRRKLILPNHTFTHVLNLALREELGDHIDQKGSIVLPDRLRFDFSHTGVVEGPALGRIEAMCEKAIGQALQVHAKEVSLQQAHTINGLRAVFGEAYPDPVRVVAIGVTVDQLLADPANPSNRQYSVEFCGGTHLGNTKQAGAFTLVSEEGVAKGVRRMVALTGDAAREAQAAAQTLHKQLASAELLDADALGAELGSLRQAIDKAIISAAEKAKMRDAAQALGKKMFELQKASIAASKAQATEAAVAGCGEALAKGQAYAVLELTVGLEPKACTEAWTAIQKAHPTLPVLFLCPDAGKGRVLAWAGVPDSLTKTISAGDWVKAVMTVLGGKGGGKPSLAQGQGPGLQKLPEAKEAAASFAQQKLK